MKFMNKKEQVLDILLTPYGEHLLSKGRFKPEYYSFYDDNVLYETQYSGFTGSQNDVEPRIQEDTPQLESQAIFSGRDLFNKINLVEYTYYPSYLPSVLENNRMEVLAEDNQISDLNLEQYGDTFGAAVSNLSLEQQNKYGFMRSAISTVMFDRYDYGLVHNLGTSDRTKTGAPAWSIDFLRGEIKNSTNALTGANLPTLNIPQINARVRYKASVVNEQNYISDTELAVEFNNGQFLDIAPDYILTQIIERNAEFSKENFSIEVFEVTEKEFAKNNLGENIRVLRPLKFRKPLNLVQNGILLDPDEVVRVVEPLTTDHVEYYFDIKVDNQIDDQIICSSLDTLKSKGLFVETEFVCEDIKNIGLADIYSTDASDGPCPDPSAGGAGGVCDDVPGSIFTSTGGGP